MKDHPIVKLLFIVISILLAIGIAEVTFRLFLPGTYLLAFHSEEYGKAQLLRRLQKKGHEEIHLRGNAIYDTNLGWRMKPLFQSEGVRHNSKGFRGGHEYTEQPEGIRIFTIGDSFTYGWGTYDEYTFTSLLDVNTVAEVINAGVNGYGIDQAYLMWELEGKKLNPSIVILGYFVGDFNRNISIVWTLPKPYFVYDENTQNYDLRGIPVPDRNSLLEQGELEVDSWLRVFRVIPWLKRGIKKRFNSNGDSGLCDYEGLLQRAQLNDYILNRLNESVTESGARLLVVIIGPYAKKSYVPSSETQCIEDFIIESCRTNGIELINLDEMMREDKFYSSFYSQNGHWTESGHRFAAEKIADALGLKQ